MQVFNAIDQKVSAKRVLVAAALVLGTVALRYLPGHQPALQSAPQTHTLSVEDNDQNTSEKTVTGQNSLFGDAGTIDNTPVTATLSDMAQYHLEVASVIDKAGHVALFDSVRPAVSDELAASTSTSASSTGAASAAVPEPSAAGFLALGVAPILVLRRRRKH